MTAGFCLVAELALGGASWASVEIVVWARTARIAEVLQEPVAAVAGCWVRRVGQVFGGKIWDLTFAEPHRSSLPSRPEFRSGGPQEPVKRKSCDLHG